MACLIALLLAFSAGGCLNTQTGPDAVAGKPFELKAGATASLPNGTRLTFEKVTEDSRCPADVQCIWAGDGVVAVTLQAPKSPAESRELHTQANGSQISYSDYTIKLSALAPYPRSSQEIRPGDYIATFVVSVR
jgi:hypothetical protein